MARIEPGRHQPQAGSAHAYDMTQASSLSLSDWESFYDLCPIADGVLLEAVVLTGGSTTTIDHTLGRDYRGFMRVRSTVAADYPADVTRDDLGNSLKLDVTNTQTVSLWVF